MSNPFEVLESKINGIEKMLSDLIEQTKASKPQKTEVELMTRKEVAKLLDCSLVSLHVRMREGAIPFYRSGRRVYFKRSEVVSSLREGKIKGGVHNG